VSEFNPPGGPDFTPTQMSAVQVVRYEIRIDASDGSPNLWRSPTGGVSTAGSGCGAGGAGTDGWRMVARGIEDLQVEYRNGTGAWSSSPGPIVAGDYSKLVREVRLTLTSRVVNEGILEGESVPTAGAARAVRGQLTTTLTPRAVLAWLAQAEPEPLWR
jgi:hypothetical protein